MERAQGFFKLLHAVFVAFLESLEWSCCTPGESLRLLGCCAMVTTAIRPSQYVFSVRLLLNGLRVFLIGLTSCNMRRTCRDVRLVHRWGARAHQAVIRRMPSSLLPRRATSCSDGITPGSRSWPPPWPREAVLAPLKTRNQLVLFSGKLSCTAIARRWRASP